MTISIKQMISKILIRVGNAVRTGINDRQAQMRSPQSFAKRVSIVFSLFLLQMLNILAHSASVLFLPSGSSFEQFHDIREGSAYTVSFSQYKSWKQRMQFFSFTSVVLVIATIGIAYVSFIDQRQSLAKTVDHRESPQNTDKSISTEGLNQ